MIMSRCNEDNQVWNIIMAILRSEYNKSNDFKSTTTGISTNTHKFAMGFVLICKL